MAASIDRIGAPYNNSPIERTIWLYRAKLIRFGGRISPSGREIETATKAWVAWLNERRLPSKLGYHSLK